MRRLLILLLCAAPALHAQTPVAGKDTLETSGLFAYFTGHWHCTGAFASGKPIASSATFTPDLENHWLQYRHDDEAPNRYHALSLWGIDTHTNRLVSVIHDNFGGVRFFMSSGWDGQRVVFDNDADHSRFIYAVDSPTAFRMRYEVSRDSARTWTLGDSLRCVKGARVSGVGSRESGVGSRVSGVGSGESGVGSRESGSPQGPA
jgi:hypothetical protein